MPDLYSYIPVHAVEQVKTYLSNLNVDIKVVADLQYRLKTN